MKTNEIVKLKAKKERLQARIAAAELREFELKELPKRRKMIGKYMKFQNSYGPADRPDKWWLFIRIIDVNKFGAVYEQIQIDCEGKLDVRMNERSPYEHVTQSYQEATKREWDLEVRRAKRIVNALA